MRAGGCDRMQDEWSGEQRLRYEDVAEGIEPQSIRPMGNYAVEITWPDGFNQVGGTEEQPGRSGVEQGGGGMVGARSLLSISCRKWKEWWMARWTAHQGQRRWKVRVGKEGGRLNQMDRRMRLWAVLPWLSWSTRRR